jgi:hypothetical protein
MFKERVGIPPKQFLQIIRFGRGFRMKNRYPDMDWLTLSQAGFKLTRIAPTMSPYSVIEGVAI